MSAFAYLLREATARLRALHRRSVALHWDYEPDAPEGRTWIVWHDPQDGQAPRLYYGASGEQCLRALVDGLQ